MTRSIKIREMQHRHLITLDDKQPFTLAAIDDIIERGGMADWRALAHATLNDSSGQLAAKILHLCQAHEQDDSQSFLAWQSFAKRIIPTA